MPRSYDQARRELYRGAGDAWTIVAELLTATAVWGAIGFGLDRAFNTWPVLFLVGAVVGHAAGIYLIWLRAQGRIGAQNRGGAKAP
jgi:F0F1-type ATP synthase assembly protein I